MIRSNVRFQTSFCSGQHYFVWFLCKDVHWSRYLSFQREPCWLWIWSSARIFLLWNQGCCGYGWCNLGYHRNCTWRAPQSRLGETLISAFATSLHPPNQGRLLSEIRSLEIGKVLAERTSGFQAFGVSSQSIHSPALCSVTPSLSRTTYGSSTCSTWCPRASSSFLSSKDNRIDSRSSGLVHTWTVFFSRVHHKLGSMILSQEREFLVGRGILHLLEQPSSSFPHCSNNIPLT